VIPYKQCVGPATDWRWMAADGTRAWFSQIRENRGTVRARTTAGAVLVVGAALLVAATALVWLLQRSLTNNVRARAELGVVSATQFLESGEPGPIQLPDNEGEMIPSGEDEVVMVFDGDGNLVSSSAAPERDDEEEEEPPRPVSLEEDFGSPEVFDELAPGEAMRVTAKFEEDDPFLAVARRAEVFGQTYKVVVTRSLEVVRESSQVVIGLLVIGIPLLLIVVGVVTWRVVGHSLAPVESIRQEVETISMDELHRRVPAPTSKDEIARLAMTMNQMLERLQEGQARQRRFVSDASHELRSPVASIRQHSEVVLAHPNNASAQELAQVVLAEDLRMQRLVEDLLLLARMDERQSNGRREVLDLDDVVFEEVYRVRQVTNKSIDTSRVSAGRVQGDRKQLSRLTGNILDNAVRHARGAIAVTLAEENGEVIFRVDDDGAGVPAAEQERIFERFVRLQEARDRDSGGAGLGLAIVAEVASAHGGTARILQSHLGGALFEIRLPRASD
jgi:signal transduction histidine kinase